MHNQQPKYSECQDVTLFDPTKTVLTSQPKFASNSQNAYILAFFNARSRVHLSNGVGQSINGNMASLVLHLAVISRMYGLVTLFSTL